MFVNNQGEQNSLEVKGSLPVLLETLSQFSKALFTMHHDHVLTRKKKKEPSVVANSSNHSDPFFLGGVGWGGVFLFLFFQNKVSLYSLAVLELTL